MRICIVGSSKRFFSGMTTHTISLANALSRRGHDVSVITFRNLVPKFLYPGRDRVGKGEFAIDYLPEVEIYDGMDWNSPRTWLGALRFLHSHNPSVVIMLWWTSSVAHMQLILSIAARLNNRPLLVMDMQDLVDPLEETILPIRLYSIVMGKLMIKRFDICTTVSKDSSQAVIRTYGVPPEIVYEIPSGGAYEEYACADREASRITLGFEGFTLLFFGNIRQYKGAPDLINAFGLLPPDVAQKSCLVIAGEDWGDDKNLQISLSNSLYRDRILYQPKFVPDELVASYFAAADVIVLPYSRTFGSAVVNIAIAQGKPIITSKLPTMEASLAGYEGVWYYPPGDIVGLKEKIVEAFQQWGNGGFANYKNASSFTWDALAAKYEEVIGHAKQGAGRVGWGEVR